jgi:hypothetical protein
VQLGLHPGVAPAEAVVSRQVLVEVLHVPAPVGLVEEDFTSGLVTQVVSDMKAIDLFTKYAGCLANSELIFVDGPKDGFTEAIFLELLGKGLSSMRLS